MLRPYQKRIIALITYLPLLVMIIASGAFVVRQINRILDQANRIVVAEFSQQLNREVRVHRTTIRPFGVAMLEGVEIAEHKKLSGGRMVSVPKVIVHYDLRNLIFGGKGAQSVSSVVLEDPSVHLVRRKDGSFNIQDLIKKPTGRPGH